MFAYRFELIGWLNSIVEPINVSLLFEILVEEEAEVVITFLQ